MSGLNFSIGGKLDRSYQASLKQAEAEAQASSLRIQNALRTRLTAINSSISSLDPASPQYAAALQKRASLENSLLMAKNAQFVAAARARMAVLNEEKAAQSAAESDRYKASTSQTGQVENLRANIEAENAAMLRNRDALRALIAERRAAAAEAQRYSSSASQVAGFANPRAGDGADNARMARFSGALKASIAASNARSELIRYNQASGVSMLELAKNVDNTASGLARAAHGASGLNLIIRETLVVFREIGRGNWTRIPGSLSLIAQGFSQLKGISLAVMGAWALAIGGIIGSFFIFYHRVKTLAKDLQTTIASSFPVEHIAKYLQKANLIPQLNKDIADSVRKIREEHDGVEASLQRQMDLTRDQITFEREMLEAQKANALAGAKNPAEREAIEKKYSGLILANKKKERDAEVKAMQDEVRKLPGEIKKTKDEIDKLTGADSGFMTEAHEQQVLKKLQSDSDAYKDYRKQLLPGEKDQREFSTEKDRKIIDDFNAKQAKFNKLVDENNLDAAIYTVTDTDRARRDAAQARLNNSRDTEKNLNAFVDGGDDRTRARARVKDLSDKIKENEDRLAKLGPRGGGLIEDKIRQNLEKDKNDLALERERLKRVDPGAPLHGREITERQSIGFGSPQFQILDVNRSMDRKLAAIVEHTRPKSGTTGGSSEENPLGPW